MNPSSPFARFEKALARHEDEIALVEGRKPEAPDRERRRKPKAQKRGEDFVATAVRMPAVLDQQVGLIADVFCISRSNTVRLMIAAAAEAIVCALEEDHEVRFPLYLYVATQIPKRTLPVRCLNQDTFERLKNLRYRGGFATSSSDLEVPATWKAGEAPKDGRLYVAIGRIALSDEWGGSSTPFLSFVQWKEGVGWLDEHGLAISSDIDAAVNIHHWTNPPVSPEE